MYKQVLHRHFINLKPCEGSSNAVASRMVLFAAIVNGFWVLTIAIKGSLLMWQGSFFRPWFYSYGDQLIDLRCSSLFGFVYESMVLSGLIRFLCKNQHSLLSCYWNDCYKTSALTSKKSSKICIPITDSSVVKLYFCVWTYSFSRF